MRNVLTFTIGVLSSATVVVLDRVGLFQAILGSRLADSLARTFGMAREQYPEIVILLVVFVLVVGGSYVARSRSRVASQRHGVSVVAARGVKRIPWRPGLYQVFYPVGFTKPPHLNVTVRGGDEYALVSERSDGFDLKLETLGAMGIWDHLRGCAILWEAQGPVSPGPVTDK